MKDLPRIVALYEEIDRRLDRERIDAEEEDEAHRITLKQLINDHAYFVLCWGQLEVEIDEVCRDVIRRRKSDPNWDVRRGFDFYNPEDRRLMTFDRRVAIVLDRGAGSGSPHGLVMKYYELRNKIAHGRLETTRIYVAAVVADFYSIQAELTRRP